VKNLVIRADAGGELGTGHVMRMIALAQAYMRRGGHVVITSVLCPEPIINRVLELGIEHHMLNGCEPGDAQDSAATLQLCEENEAQWLVLDGYHFDEEYQQRLAGHDIKVLCVDDYGHCETWNCDAVLNQNLGAENWGQRKSKGSDIKWLLGSSFALIREEFFESIRQAKEKKSPACRILVTMGGADPDNITLKVLRALEENELEGLELRVLVGGANPHQAKLTQFADSSRHQIEVLCNVREMPPMYEWADAVISAGGSTCWEWLSYGLSGAVVTIAVNQEPVVAELESRKLALTLGWFTEYDMGTWAAKLESWVLGQQAGGNFSERRQAVDGYGATRTAAFLDTGIWCRRAQSKDAKLYFDWASDPVVRASGFHTDELSWEDHVMWFDNMIQSSDTYLYVVSNAFDEKIGQVRLTPDPSGYLEISFSVARNLRGKGMGSMMLQEVLQRTLSDNSKSGGFIARVKKENQASAKIFHQLGFEASEDDPKHRCLVYLKKNII